MTTLAFHLSCIGVDRFVWFIWMMSGYRVFSTTTDLPMDVHSYSTLLLFVAMVFEFSFFSLFSSNLWRPMRISLSRFVYISSSVQIFCALFSLYIASTNQHPAYHLLLFPLMGLFRIEPVVLKQTTVNYSTWYVITSVLASAIPCFINTAPKIMIPFNVQLALIVIAYSCLIIGSFVSETFFPYAFQHWTPGKTPTDEQRTDYIPDWKLFYNIFGQETVIMAPTVTINRYYSTIPLQWADTSDIHSALPVVVVSGSIFWIIAIGIRVMPDFIHSTQPDRVAFRYQTALNSVLIGFILNTVVTLSNQSIYTFFLPIYFLGVVCVVDTLYDLTPLYREHKIEAEDFLPYYFNDLHVFTILVSRFLAVISVWFFGFYTGIGSSTAHLIVVAALAAQLSHDI